MKIILRKDYTGLGQRGDIVNVKSGYARNKLIPEGIAFEYSTGNMKRFEEEKKYIKIRSAKDKKNAEELAKKLEELSITFTEKAQEDVLYGSVNETMIAKELEKLGYPIEKHQILLDEPIKKIGVFEIQIKLHSEITARIKIWIVKDE